MNRQPTTLSNKATLAAALAVALAIPSAAGAIPHVQATMPGASSTPSHHSRPKREREKREKPAKHDPAAAAKLKDEADSLHSEGKNEEAAKLYEQAFTEDPSNTPLIENYGRTLYALARYHDAAEMFQKVAKSSDPASYWNLGYALRKSHDYEGAAKAYYTYVKVAPEDPDGLYQVAECYRKLGRFDDAIAAYNAYAKHETRPEEQSWVEKSKQKIVSLQQQAAAAAPPPVVVAAPPMNPGLVVAMPGASPVTPSPVAAPVAPAPVAVAPAPVAVPAPAVEVAVAPTAAPVVVAAAPVAMTPPPVAVTPAPAPVVIAPAPVVVAPAPAPVVVAPAPAPVVVAPAPMAPPPMGMMRDPNGAIAKVQEGDQSFHQKQFNDALAAYQDAVKLDDQCVSAYLKMGLAYANMGQFQAAIDQWNRVLQLDPGNKYATNYIAKATPRLASAAPPPSAAAPLAAVPVAPAPSYADAARPVSPEDEEAAKALYKPATQALREARYDEAITGFTQALAKNPNYTNAYVARGGAYYASKNYPAAIADYMKALSLNPNLATPQFGLAKAYEKSGNTPQSCDAFRKYLQSTGPDVQDRLKTQAQTAVATCPP